MSDLVFRDRPRLGGAYLRAVLARRRGLADGEPVPRLSARWVRVRADPVELAAYRAACGSVADVPITWPQVAATRLHVALVTDPRFPIRPTGLVHPRFTVSQRRPLRAGEVYDLEAEVGGRRDTPTGFEFDLSARALVDGDCVWESVASTYVRLRAGTRRPTADLPVAWDATRPMAVAASAGRAYARLSGDWNPVHVHPLTARAFGYRRPIAHGWFLLARCLGALASDAPARVTFDLLRPVFLPSALTLGSRRQGEATAFALFGEDGKDRVQGLVEPDEP